VTYEKWLPDVGKFDAIVHLAGEPVAAKRWTEEQKKIIWSSRIDTTREIVVAIGKSEKKPKVFVCASATGYYGDRGEELLPEREPAGEGFLARLCYAWEGEAVRAATYGVRVTHPRIGIVLGKSGGALKQMLPLYKLGLGGPMGSGQQWFPWIHVHDLCALILFSIDRDEARGALNAVSPDLVRDRDFARKLGRVLGRPAFVRKPKFVLNMMLGEVATALTASQHVVPERTRKLGFSFTYPDLEQALRNILKG
jgi:uncharacterized protein (TIGR01777 family)